MDSYLDKIQKTIDDIAQNIINKEYQIINLCGPSGTGKSHIVENVAAKLKDKANNIAVIQLFGDMGKKSIPYFPFNQYLEYNSSWKKGLGPFIEGIPYLGVGIRHIIDTTDCRHILGNKRDIKDNATFSRNLSFSKELFLLFKRFSHIAIICDDVHNFDQDSIDYLRDIITEFNIKGLNCFDCLTLKLNPSTLDAIKSNFRIFEQDNVRQYIKVRNDLSKDLLDLQDKINNIVEGFTGDFRKNVVGLGTFFLTLVVVRVVANGQWKGAFSTQIVLLSFVFIALSVVLLIYSRRNLEQREKLYTKHYGQLRERYKLLLSNEEADKIFEDSDPNKVGTHSNYINCQKKTYTLIWIVMLVVLSLFLVGVWCFNLFESTNLFKIIKAIVLCCTKNM